MPTVRWLDDTEQALWRGYLESTRLLFRSLDRQLTRDAGISLADFEILVVLSEAPEGRLRMSDLADAMTTTRGGVTRAVNRLVGAGWVRRVECREDRRGALAELTAAGSDKLADAAPGHVAAVRRHLFDLLNRADVEHFAHIYAEVRNRLRHSAAGAAGSAGDE